MKIAKPFLRQPLCAAAEGGIGGVEYSFLECVQSRYGKR